MASVDATPYLAAYPARHVRRPVVLELTSHSYPVEPEPGESWLPLAFRAFSRLAARMPVRDLLVVGTGNGLDALGALEIFELRSLAVTDLTEESLAVARRNVLANVLDPHRVALSFHAGDLLSCVPAGARFCLVYENLPNIRAGPGMDLAHGALAGRFFAAPALRVPELFETHLLALHYECLQQARDRVREGGGVLTALGGRIPLEVAFELHRSCGFVPDLVTFDVKPQTEPELVLPAYCAAEERHGLEFRYYAAEALTAVAQARREGLDGSELARAVEADLLDHALSAREALARSRRGEAIAHSVFMVFGERRGG